MKNSLGVGSALGEKEGEKKRRSAIGDRQAKRAERFSGEGKRSAALSLSPVHRSARSIFLPFPPIRSLVPGYMKN